MVYCDSEELKWMPYVKTWINDVCAEQLREETQEYLWNLFDRTVEHGLRFVSKKCVQAIAQVLLLVTVMSATNVGVARIFSGVHFS